jgi:hypothetical protein
MGEEGELPAAFPFPFLRFPYLPAAPVVTCFPKRKQFKVSGIAPLCSGPNLLRDFIILFFPKNLSTSRRSQKRYIFWGFLNKKKRTGRNFFLVQFLSPGKIESLMLPFISPV